ncbi:hypothetical protein EVAR_84035_1 [Eumeta japonica]|uniref:Uncharacterized protein n=1 Tax=Eumeta variegata TaxID=151549 RepID=A0A4C1X724_EUMVA|nr:hypothetical protein EVAR_84035_1 [Eumeta japonica]
MALERQKSSVQTENMKYPVLIIQSPRRTPQSFYFTSTDLESSPPHSSGASVGYWRPLSSGDMSPILIEFSRYKRGPSGQFTSWHLKYLDLDTRIRYT